MPPPNHGGGFRVRVEDLREAVTSAVNPLADHLGEQERLLSESTVNRQDLVTWAVYGERSHRESLYRESSTVYDRYYEAVTTLVSTLRSMHNSVSEYRDELNRVVLRYQELEDDKSVRFREVDEPSRGE